MKQLAESASPHTAMRGASRALQLFLSIVVAVGVAAGMGASAKAANIVVNGGFEANGGSFDGWTTSPNFDFVDNGVECPGALFVPEGLCDAFLGQRGSDASLSQILTTVPGRTYVISFALESDGSTPSHFAPVFGSVPLINLTNLPVSPFHLLTFLVPATAATTPLIFNFRDDFGFLHLDAVTVGLAPEPGTIALLGISLVGLWAGRRRKKT